MRSGRRYGAYRTRQGDLPYAATGDGPPESRGTRVVWQSSGVADLFFTSYKEDPMTLRTHVPGPSVRAGLLLEAGLAFTGGIP